MLITWRVLGAWRQEELFVWITFTSSLVNAELARRYTGLEGVAVTAPG